MTIEKQLGEQEQKTKNPFGPMMAGAIVGGPEINAGKMLPPFDSEPFTARFLAHAAVLDSLHLNLFLTSTARPNPHQEHHLPTPELREWSELRC